MSDVMDLVFGEYRDDELVFIPRRMALDLAKVRQALKLSRNWGEFIAELPEIYRFAIEDWIDAAHLEGRKPPAKRDPFDSMSIGMVREGRWPENPAAEMLDWVPWEIQERCGTVKSDRRGVKYLHLPGSHTESIEAAFRHRGYRCTEDTLLVRRACGY